MLDHDVTEQSQASNGAILSVSVSASALGKRWAHCGQLVDYMGRYAGIHGDDAKRDAMMFSAVLNGVIEAIARHHATRGAIKLQLRQGAGALQLVAVVPVEQAHHRFYAEAEALVGRPDLKEWYLAQIARGGMDCDPTLLALAELATTFRSEIRITQPPAGDTVAVTAVFPLSEMEES